MVAATADCRLLRKGSAERNSTLRYRIAVREIRNHAPT